MKKGFFRDCQNSLHYRGEKYEYSLLDGVTDTGYTSDIMFIFREPTSEELDNNFAGAVVDFVYGGFEDLDFVEQRILEYEKKED